MKKTPGIYDKYAAVSNIAQLIMAQCIDNAKPPASAIRMMIGVLRHAICAQIVRAKPDA